jgi:hypothetical protein
MKSEPTPYQRAARVVVPAAVLLLVPLVAMQFTDQVVWTPSDFAVAGTLLLGTGLLYQLAAGRIRNFAYRAAMGLALFSALFLVWANLAVGLIGTEHDRANLMYLGVIAIGFGGGAVTRLRPEGMARVLFAMAAVQAAIGAIALALGLGAGTSRPIEIVGATGLFVGLFTGSGLLFLRAAAGGARTAAGS